LNPIELVWSHLSQQISIIKPKTPKELQDKLVYLWNRIPKKFLRNLMKGFDKRVRIIYALNGARYNRKKRKLGKRNYASFQQWVRKTVEYDDEVERIEMSEKTKAAEKKTIEKNIDKVLAVLEKQKQKLSQKAKECKPKSKKSTRNETKNANERFNNLLVLANEILGKSGKKEMTIKDIVDVEYLEATIIKYKELRESLETMDSTSFQKFYFEHNNQKKIKSMICTNPEFVSSDPMETLSNCETKIDDEKSNSLQVKKDFDISKYQEECRINAEFLGVQLENEGGKNLCFLNVLVHVIYRMDLLKEYFISSYFSNIFLIELKDALCNYKRLIEEKKKNSKMNLDKLRKHINWLDIDDFKARQHDSAEVFQKLIEFTEKCTIQSQYEQLVNASSLVDCSKFIVRLVCDCGMVIREELNNTFNLKKSIYDNSLSYSNVYFTNRETIEGRFGEEKGLHEHCSINKTYGYYCLPPKKELPKYLWIFIHSKYMDSAIKLLDYWNQMTTFIEKLLPTSFNETFFQNEVDRVESFSYSLQTIICLYLTPIGSSSIARHFIVYLRNYNNEWVLHDDESLRAFKTFEDLKNNMISNKFMPYYCIYSLNEEEKQSIKKRDAINAVFRETKTK